MPEIIYRGHLIRPAVTDRPAGDTFYPRAEIESEVTGSTLDTTLGWPIGCRSRQAAEAHAIMLAKRAIDLRWSGPA